MAYSQRHFPVLRFCFFVFAAAIIVASTVFSNRLARELALEEQDKIELWAEAIRMLARDDGPSEADSQMNYELALKILQGNNNIPVLLTDMDGSVLSHANLRLNPHKEGADLDEKAAAVRAKERFIEIKISDTYSQYVYYDDSRHLKQLKYFPFIQLAVMFIFLAVTLLALSISKRSEQDRVWVGLSKETAHQLGTPISSLVAWEELLKMKEVDPNLLTEIEKDTRRLQTIAERFSKIGSKPEPKPEALVPAIESAINYMRGRCSQKVSIQLHQTDFRPQVCLCVPLFEWVMENLCKNAIDAMDGNGRIDIRLGEERKKVFIDVTDTGKGIAKNRFKDVFKPGYTTKARGWGLGLSLVKRIVEEYHRGRIFVKSSEIGKGTTFRILLDNYENN